MAIMSDKNDYFDPALLHKEHCSHLLFSMKAIADAHCKKTDTFVGMSRDCGDAYRKVMELTQKCYQTDVIAHRAKK